MMKHTIPEGGNFMHILFYGLLTIHLFAVTVKLAVLFRTPFLQDKDGVVAFLSTYKKVDRTSDLTLWITAVGMILTTSIQYLLQMWLLVSMLLYTIIFWLIKRVVVRRMTDIATSKKIYAHEEMKKLRFENWCVAFTTLGLLMGIGSLMMTKPF